MSDLLDIVLEAAAAGLSVVPPKEDGTKAPLGLWKQFQTTRPDENQLRSWYANGRQGLGIICGAVSGDLEMLELEGRAVDEGIFDELIDKCAAEGLGDVLDRIVAGYSERTPSGGLHLLYRCETIAGNLKLASRPATAEELAERPGHYLKVLIETRGEGGYVVVAPTSGALHESGEPWAMVAGGFATIATIAPEERGALLEIARSFNLVPEPPPRSATMATPKSDTRPGESPLDQYDRDHTCNEVLERHGFLHHHDDAQATHYTRPGKDPRRGSSAAVWHDNGAATLFSTSIDAPPEFTDGTRWLRPCQLEAALGYAGDFKKLAQDLMAEQRDDWSWAIPAGQQPPIIPGVQMPVITVTEPTDLFRRYSMAELLELDLTTRWIVRGILADPTYGQVAGAMKSFKSYVGTMLDLSIATGTRFLGRFPVTRPAPVVTYIGEGGRIPWTRRTTRIAAAMGINDLRDVDLYHPSFDVAPIGSDRFRESLERDLGELGPALFHLDPYYAYHGATVDSRNLHHEGSLLASVSAPCMAAGTSCLITNHFNQTGTGKGLDRITQAGSGEWVDSWLLLSHRSAPDLEHGLFKLLLEVGSRQWGGTSWDLDLSVGTLDEETGEHHGAFEWAINRHVEESAEKREAGIRETIRRLVAANPWALTKTELKATIGGNAGHAGDAIDLAAQTGDIAVRRLPRDEKGRAVTRAVYGLPTQPVPQPEQVDNVQGQMT